MIAMSIGREALENCLLLRQIQFDRHKIYNFILFTTEFMKEYMNERKFTRSVGRCDVKILLEYRWAAYIVRSISAHFKD